MENKYAGKSCFVIMPFGKKTDLDGKPIDFDFVYQNVIKDAVEEAGLECVRCDEIIDTGSIHFKMFHGIFEADVAVVDITSRTVASGMSRVGRKIPHPGSSNNRTTIYSPLFRPE